MYAAVHVRTHAFAGAHRYTHAPKRVPTAPHPPPLVREGRTIHAHTHHPAPQTTTAPHQWRHTEVPHKPSKSITAVSGTLIPPERRKSLKTAENRLVYIHTHTHTHALGRGLIYKRVGRINPRSRAHTCAHAHPCVRPYARARTRTYAPACTPAPACLPVHPHAYARSPALARAPACLHTHAHT